MEKYRFPYINLPGTLYRVDFPGSQTKYNQAGCLLAAEKERLYEDKTQDLEDFKRDILDQYLWRAGPPSPFIALFSSREAAESWASEEFWREDAEPLTPPHMDWSISVFDVQKMKKGSFFRLKDLVEMLGLEGEIPEDDWYYAENTYLCLHRIPAKALLERVHAEQVVEHRFERLMAEFKPEEESDLDDLE